VHERSDEGERRGIAVVTGASAGVGRATAVALARRGFDVGLLARGEAGLDAARRDVEREGRAALVVPTDVADAAAVESAATDIERELGDIDVWVNNAMTTVFAPSWDVEADEFRRATEVTYLGQVYGTMAALRRMRPRDRGHIVNVGSALAFRAIPLQSAYCGAKFATRGFTEAVRTELLHTGSSVRISMVHLPAVNTPQFDWCLNRLPKHPQPVPPIYQPEVAADAIVAAALDGRRQKILGVFNTSLVEVNKLVPGFVDHYVARTGFSSQQMDEDAGDGDADLWKPVDGGDGVDHGARGRFGDRAHGMFDPSFLRSVPAMVRDAALAASGRARELAVSRASR
jgi:short-subunit dehydrogenase